MRVPLRVAPGELIDRLTILELKVVHATRAEQREVIRRDLDELRATQSTFLPESQELAGLVQQLRTLNGQLWDAEDEVRARAARGQLDAAFCSCALRIGRLNDERAALKARINALYTSEQADPKIYAVAEYAAASASGQRDEEPVAPAPRRQPSEAESRR